MISEVAKGEMSIVAKELRLRSLLAMADQVVADLYDEVARAEVASVARDAVRELHEERERKIEELRELRRRRCLKKFFAAWLKLSRKRRRQRNALLQFPAMPGSFPLEEQVRPLSVTVAVITGPTGRHLVRAKVFT